MLRAKLIALCALAAAVLAGCATEQKSLAGTPSPAGHPSGHGRIDDPRNSHLTCLKDNHIRAVKVGQTDIQIDTAPTGARVTFTPTPGAAQDAQITGRVQAAEVIGSALLFPNQASDTELQVIEDCLAEGVSG